MRHLSGWFPLTLFTLGAFAALIHQGSKQPTVQPGPNEPDWLVLADRLYGLRIFDDLLNPVETTTDATPGLFRKAGPGKVVYRPILAWASKSRSVEAITSPPTAKTRNFGRIGSRPRRARSSAGTA